MEKAVNDNTDFIEAMNIPPQFRYERKFTVEQPGKAQVLYHIKKHPAQFREIFYPRQINNIYLDTPQFKFYVNNEIGIADRKKVRIRWYGSTFGQVLRPKLEYKIKAGLLGDKWGFDLVSFEVSPGFHNRTLAEIFKASDLPNPVLEDLRFLRPSLLNAYRRTYFLSADGRFRLTLDEQMCYYRIDHPHSNFIYSVPDPTHFIIELKYVPEEDDGANRIAQHFPYRLNKSSKYVNGVVALRLVR